MTLKTVYLHIYVPTQEQTVKSCKMTVKGGDFRHLLAFKKKRMLCTGLAKSTHKSHTQNKSYSFSIQHVSKNFGYYNYTGLYDSLPKI